MNFQIVMILLIAMVAGCVFFYRYYFNRKTIVKRKLKKATGKKISDFVTGDIAKVVGKVEIVGVPLIAPLSGRPCAYYYVLVEQEKSYGRSSSWETLIEEEVGGEFVIRDGRYRAHINSDNIKSYLVQDREYSSGFGEDASDILEKYLQDHGEKSEGLFNFNKKIRYKEGVLEQDEFMAVIGRGEWKNASQIKLPESYGRVLSIDSTEEEPVYLSDDPDTVETAYSGLSVSTGL